MTLDEIITHPNRALTRIKELEEALDALGPERDRMVRTFKIALDQVSEIFKEELIKQRSADRKTQRATDCHICHGVRPT